MPSGKKAERLTAQPTPELEPEPEYQPRICPICLDEYHNGLLYIKHLKKHTAQDRAYYGIDLEALL